MSRVWLAVGTPQNWQTAFEQGNTWGLKPTQASLWTALNEGDTLVFYVTKPIGGTIGYGVVHTKLRQDKPLWSQEVRERRVIWPLRLAFQITYLLPQDRWLTNRVITPRLRNIVRGGFQLLEASLAEEILTVLTASGPGQLPEIIIPHPAGAEIGPEYTPSIATSLSPHDATKLQLVEIGRMQYMLAESEYEADGTRLDVVWRRAERAVPLFAFEVQVGGDIYHALVKLKQAFQLWNSRVYLVAPHDEYRKYEGLVSGAFPEIRDRMRFIPIPKIEELYRSKLHFKELERQLGIP